MDAMTRQIFEDRAEAGARLARSLDQFKDSNTVVLAIPRGGVPVAASAAQVLHLEWHVIVARKLPIPWNPEAGFGAVAVDGSVVLNERILHGLQLHANQIDEVVSRVRSEVARRNEIYSGIRPSLEFSGRTVIVVDDGLASGYTMLAAIKSIRAHEASLIVAAAPVASKSAAALVMDAADLCVFEIISSSMPFAVADYYLQWHDLTDEDIVPLLRAG